MQHWLECSTESTHTCRPPVWPSGDAYCSTATSHIHGKRRAGGKVGQTFRKVNAYWSQQLSLRLPHRLGSRSVQRKWLLLLSCAHNHATPTEESNFTSSPHFPPNETRVKLRTDAATEPGGNRIHYYYFFKSFITCPTFQPSLFIFLCLVLVYNCWQHQRYEQVICVHAAQK